MLKFERFLCKHPDKLLIQICWHNDLDQKLTPKTHNSTICVIIILLHSDRNIYSFYKYEKFSNNDTPTPFPEFSCSCQPSVSKSCVVFTRTEKVLICQSNKYILQDIVSNYMTKTDDRWNINHVERNSCLALYTCLDPSFFFSGEGGSPRDIYVCQGVGWVRGLFSVILVCKMKF